MQFNDIINMKVIILHDKVIVNDSLGNVLREERASEYDWGITESIFLLNFACKIKPISISKKLGIFIRNLSTEEIEYCYPKVSLQIKDAMKIGYDKIVQYENAYNEKLGEQTNMQNFVSNGIEFNLDEMKEAFVYIYSKQMHLYGRLDKKILNSEKCDFDNIEEYSNKVAKGICSNLIVLEIKDYKYLYSIFDKYYSLNNDPVRANWSVKKFINNCIKFMNIIFLQSDSYVDETKCNFQICEFEDFKFDIYEMAKFYDGYYHNLYLDREKSKKLELIRADYIDHYIENNNENLNNLLFIVSRMIKDDSDLLEVNYREYNLNLITILELLLVNSKSENEVANKFVKNVLICLSINGYSSDILGEKAILNAIYRYRSCILHGNYSGYTNAMSDLEKLLKYKPEDYEFSKYNTIDYLISKKLNMYVSTVFRTISNNKYIIEIIKN